MCHNSPTNFYYCTSPAGVTAKYCDEYVCLCVCLSARISPEPHAQSLPNFLCMLPMWLGPTLAY